MTGAAAERRKRLKGLLEPRSIVFVGGEAAGRAIEQCRALGFAGDLWPVHPTRREIRGVPVFASIADLPAAPDAAFVGVNRHETIGTVAELAALGTGAAVCYASGFAEAGPEGAGLQAQLLAGADGMPIVGPNCYGTISATSGAALWPDQQGLHRTDAGIAVLTQSGNIALNLTMQDRGLAIARVIAVGNQGDHGLEDWLDIIVDDASVTGVALHIETLRDVARFAEAAARARRRGVPLVALKTGATVRGASITASHTSSLAGDDAAYGALFARLGVRRVHSIPELIDTLHVVDAIGPRAGARVVSLNSSGGEAALVADLAPRHEIELTPFEPGQVAQLRSTLTELVAIDNPLDFHTFIWGDEERLTSCFTAALDGPHDVAMLVLDFPRAGVDGSGWWTALRAFGAACSATGTPGVVTASMSENMPTAARSAAAELELAALADIDSALRCIEAAVWFGRHEYQPPPHPTRVAPTIRTVTLPETEGKARLGEAGIRVPRGEVIVVGTGAGAEVSAARRIGHPVVAKSVGIVHKSDHDAVRAGLADDDAVAAAVAHLRRHGRPILIEEHVDGVAELLVTVRRDEPVGYVLTIGAGGTMVELLRDTCVMLLPVATQQIEAALRSLAIWPQLAGTRRRPRADTDAIVEFVRRLATLVEDRPEVIEIEVNPLVVGPDSAIAVDVLLTEGVTDD